MTRKEWITTHAVSASAPFERKFVGHRAARDAAQAQTHVGQRVIRVRRDLEALHQTHEEHEELLPRERLAETHALSDAERVQTLEQQLGYSTVNV